MIKTLALIPCYNEESTIKDTILEINKSQVVDEIWVIDNGSTDNTAEVSRKLGVVVISSPQKGKGFALRHAFSLIEKKFDAVFVVDGDATYSIKELNYAIDLVVRQGFDMVIGRRYIKNELLKNKPYRLGHKLGNTILSRLFSKLINLNISDAFSGWRVMSIGFVKSFHGGNSGFEIEVELNAHAYLLSAPITEIKVEYFARKEGSHSKLRTFPDGFKIIKKQLLLFRNERPLAAFNILAMIFLVLSVFLIWRAFSGYILTGLVSKFPSLIVGIGLFILSCLLWVLGFIGERVRINRVQAARYVYSKFMMRTINKSH